MQFKKKFSIVQYIQFYTIERIILIFQNISTTFIDPYGHDAKKLLTKMDILAAIEFEFFSSFFICLLNSYNKSSKRSSEKLDSPLLHIKKLDSPEFDFMCIHDQIFNQH